MIKHRKHSEDSAKTRRDETLDEGRVRLRRIPRTHKSERHVRMEREMSHPVFSILDGEVKEKTKRRRRMESRVKKAKMIFIPKSNGSIETIKQDTNLDALQQNIDMFEVDVSRKASNIAYDFIVDDEGSFAGRDNINNFSILGYQMHKLETPYMETSSCVQLT